MQTAFISTQKALWLCSSCSLKYQMTIQANFERVVKKYTACSCMLLNCQKIFCTILSGKEVYKLKTLWAEIPLLKGIFSRSPWFRNMFLWAWQVNMFAEQPLLHIQLRTLMCMSFLRSLILSYKNLQNTSVCVLSFQNPEEYHSLITFRRNMKCYLGKRKLINSCLFVF